MPPEISTRQPSVAVIAPASAAPLLELASGVEFLRDVGFEAFSHPQCQLRHFTFAGDDRQRAAAIAEVAFDPAFELIWCACGGYGAMRLLPLLDELTTKRGLPPVKTLIGYSDITALHQFARRRWNWHTLHAPMVTTLSLPTIDRQTMSAILDLARGVIPQQPWGDVTLEYITPRPPQAVRGRIIGGNLSLWAAMQGTRYAPKATRNDLLFFEDVGEPIYRIDRMVTQLLQSGALEASAIVLGDFTNCKDDVTQVLVAEGDGLRKGPLRPAIELRDALIEIFGGVGRRLGMPVVMGLPVGHGPHYRPLPLGAVVELSVEGRLSLLEWDGALGS